ncbi:MAG TPA: hypothetical protein VFU20_01605, partial [Sphingomicrobium sp.]|nr:hypothetical protein [Sphingomicrobium sp.]
ALAFLAFGLWLRLGRLDRTRLRALLFVPISFIVFFAHTFGWGTLGLLCFSAEAVRQHDRGAGWRRSGMWAALHAMVMALPALVILAWRSNIEGPASREWFAWNLKLEALLGVLRDRWMTFDWLSLAVVALVILYAIFSRRLTLSRNLAFSALVLLAGFLLLPWVIFSSAYADMRLLPFVFAVAILAIRFRRETHLPTARVLAVLGLAFFLVRIGANTVSLAMAADDQRSKLAALEHVPMGARVASLTGRGCGREWPMARNAHLGAMVIVRRHGFSNDQWVTPGLNLLRLRNRDAGAFSADPSQIVRPNGCRPRSWRIDRALGALPREHFDYLWLIQPPPYDPRRVAGMQRVWSGPGSQLFRVNPGGAGRPPATPRTGTAPGR